MQDITFEGMVERIINWNKVAGNGSHDFNRHLENSMLIEELSEAIIAIKKDDKIELIDGILDFFVIGVGTLYKKGFTAKQITACMNEIMDSNYSKFIQNEDGTYHTFKDSTGKVKKPENYRKPDLERALEECEK